MILFKAPLAYARDIDAEEEEPLAVIHVLGLNLGLAPYL